MHTVLTRLMPNDPRAGNRLAVADWLRAEQGGAWLRDDKGESVTLDAWLRGDGDPKEFKSRLMPLINRFRNQREELTADDVLIGASYVCNSDRDYYYSRFSHSALHENAELIVGKPKMRMHNIRTGEPLARTFDADVVERMLPNKTKRDSQWLKTDWYVLNDDDGKRVIRRVGAGLDDEDSIQWACAGADCSECSDPIYACRHIPGDIYSKGMCEFEFSGITRVIEDSFVHAGGQKNTTNFIPDGDRAAPAAAVAVMVNRFLDAVSGEMSWDRIAAAKREFLTNVPGMDRAIRHAAEVHRRALGMGTMCAEPGDRQNVQAVSVSKQNYPDVKAAARWARDHDFRADHRSETDSDWVFAQMKEDGFESARFRDQRLDPGVKARIGKRKAQESQEPRARTMADLFGQKAQAA